MNEPMHLVPRKLILSMMRVLEDIGITQENHEYSDMRRELDEITDKPPSNIAVKLIA